MRIGMILNTLLQCVILWFFCPGNVSPGHEYCPRRTLPNGGCESVPNARRVCEKYGEMWYLVVPECKTWHDAKDHCIRLGLQLSNIRSLLQNRWLARMSCYHLREMWWVGPYSNSNPWLYSNADNSPLPGDARNNDGVYWARPEPNYEWEPCVVFGFDKLWLWTDFICNTKAKFFCESKFPNCQSMNSANGAWSTWTSWSACSASCVTSRTRNCDNPPPANNGKTCEGDFTQSKNCFHQFCPFWGEWSRFTACSVTCGDGTKSRTRTCLSGPGCIASEKEKCSFQKCFLQNNVANSAQIPIWVIYLSVSCTLVVIAAIVVAVIVCRRRRNRI